MKILLLGSGGREHAMAWKMAQSEMVENLYVLPGNDGMALLPKVSTLFGSVTDIPLILKTSKELGIDLVVIGPENPLSEGVTDALEEKGVKVFGPSRQAAQLESSKVFSKNFMVEYDIPTAKALSFDNYDEAKAAMEKWDITQGIVIKADELAAGKGVVVTKDRVEAEKTLFDFMKNPDCTVKTKRVLLEEMLTGKEVSAFAICDGENFISLGYACDYKRVGNGDTGPNTGGMGGYSPKNWPSDTTKSFIEEKVFKTVLRGMKEMGMPFKGILFAGLMVEGDNPKVIEFNVRLGDPETQILLPLVAGDLVPTLYSAAQGKLSELGSQAIKLKNETSVHIVMTSGGYPSTDGTKMDLGNTIDYPQELLPNEVGASRNNYMFLAGAKKNEAGDLVNSGGRVLGVTALASELEGARKLAYETLKDVSFKGAHWRTDIGL
ncbi:MAG: phosphoribosylamine--glycine ligase [Epsilonproteobacteria bacterium]|nr:MAG: phosphoribosylamine--glycine ligase [Campylobacterota bacterium]RLA63683.1 MAG: phosphoribosylamine--glycine ligase [Campylobacterota bacterium]